MRSESIAIENLQVSRVVLWLRLAGVICIASGLIGGYVWLVDLGDRSDGDSLRWGFWHNPFMQFPPFNEAFLDLSMWVLFACSGAVGLGGLLLLVPQKWGVGLVTWQARISIIFNSVIVFFIVAMIFVFPNKWEEWRFYGTFSALALRLGAIAVDVILWGFLRSNAVGEFFRWRAHPAGRAFDVIIKEAEAPSGTGDGT